MCLHVLPLLYRYMAVALVLAGIIVVVTRKEMMRVIKAGMDTIIYYIIDQANCGVCTGWVVCTVNPT